MSKKISKEEIENQFQAFLRQSGSSDDSTFEITSKKKKKAEANLWWLEDSDREENAKTGAGTSSGGKSFLKSKQPVAESKQAETSESENVQVKSSKLKKTNSDKGRTRNKLEVSPKRNRNRPEASMSKDSLEDISEKSEEHEPDGKRSVAPGSRAVMPDSSLDTTKDSYTTDALTDEPDDVARVGIDTLEENAEKQKLFMDLEVNGTVDYSRLNQEMSRTEFGLSPGGAAKVVDLLDDSEVHEPERQMDKASVTSADKASSQMKPSMLSKVSLLDSLDSTLNTTTSPKATMPGQKSRDMEPGEQQNDADFLKTQTGTVIGTNTSKEIEAFNEALREVGMSTTYKPDGDILSELMPQDGGQPTAAQTTTGAQATVKANNGKERNVGDILREMEELKLKVKQKEDEMNDVRLMGDYQSPRSPSPSSSSRRLQRQSRMDDDQKQGGFDYSHTDDTEVYQPVTAVGKVHHMSYRRSLQEKKTKKACNDSEATASSKPGLVKKSKSKTKFQKVQSSGYGRRSSGPSPTRVSSKSPPKQRSKTQMWSPANVAEQKIKGTETPQVEQKTPDIVDSQLMHSIESFAAYISNHFTGTDMPGVKLSKEEPSISSSKSMFDKMQSSEKDRVMVQELDSVRKQLQEEREHGIKLQENISAMEESFQKEMEALCIEHEQELFKLKQENFVLAAKVSEGSSEPSELRKRLSETTDMTNEKIKMFEKEIKEQEGLLVGYQQENRKLYEESRNVKKMAKLTEEKMFMENQKLVTQMAFLKSQMEEKDDQLRNKGVITSLAAQQQIAVGNSEVAISEEKILDLVAELKETKRREENLQRELKVMQKTKLELDQHIDQLIQERESLHKGLEEANTLKPEQTRVLQEKHNEEVAQLNRKLKWYAENQELLDKGVLTVQKQDETIHQLKMRVEELQTQAGKRFEENKLRNRERAADARKVQDYQRQVKEMEQIIRRRHPNSLPALMLTAANAVESTSKSPSVQVLENQIKNLQKELEGKDEQANTMLRSMEQKYNTVKLQFEERVADLEHRLEGYLQMQEQCLKEHARMVTLELELEKLRDRSTQEIIKLHNQVETQTSELSRVKSSHHSVIVRNEDGSSEEIICKSDSDARLYQTVSDLKNQLIQVQGDVKDKKHELQALSVSLERLTKEKHMYMMIAHGHHATQTDDITKDTKKAKVRGKMSKKKQEENKVNGVQKGFTTFTSGELNGRQYEPTSFADNHVYDILLENENLKMKIDDLHLAFDQQRIDLSKSLAESEFCVRRTRENYENQIETLRASHQQQLQKILGDQALQHSSSKLAKLQSKCDTQEVMIQHLQEQVAKCSDDAEQVSILKIKLAAQQTQVEKLQQLLYEAKQNRTPEMRHFASIEEKVIELEKRHVQREQELQRIIQNTQQVASVELREEVNKWKNIVDIKNQEIQTFRAELDSILDVLRVLQKQGVVLPVSGYS